MTATTRHEEFQPSIRNQALPEGVRAYGYRYQATISTPSRTHVIGEYETPEQAHAAYLEAQASTWNG